MFVFGYKNNGLLDSIFNKNREKLYGFRAGRNSTQLYLTESQYQNILSAQLRQPIRVMNDAASKKQWWMLNNEFWWEDDSCTPAEVQLLIIDKLKQKDEQKKRQVAKAIAHVSQPKSPSITERQPIPDDVKLFVWQRDGGRCVKCGSQEKLEYDHIIPLAKGGSNTARNIQLLCENCNRSKGANLI
ncbi:MAG TPA: HNH endonuclease [Anaerolineales bacterium]|nr:HNH endonuclease [Anaerolineales bacterium]